MHSKTIQNKNNKFGKKKKKLSAVEQMEQIMRN